MSLPSAVATLSVATFAAVLLALLATRALVTFAWWQYERLLLALDRLKAANARQGEAVSDAGGDVAALHGTTQDIAARFRDLTARLDALRRAGAAADPVRVREVEADVAALAAELDAVRAHLPRVGRRVDRLRLGQDEVGRRVRSLEWTMRATRPLVWLASRLDGPRRRAHGSAT